MTLTNKRMNERDDFIPNYISNDKWVVSRTYVIRVLSINTIIVNLCLRIMTLYNICPRDLFWWDFEFSGQMINFLDYMRTKFTLYRISFVCPETLTTWTWSVTEVSTGRNSFNSERLEVKKYFVLIIDEYLITMNPVSRNKR